MRTLLHLSDLDFERADDSTAEALLAAAREARPDVVVVSGEVTQGARRLLDALPSPRVVVPGDHAEDAEPFHEDEELVVAGLTNEHGSISDQQLNALRDRLCSRAEGVTKIVVTHHPFDPPEGDDDGRDIAGHAPETIEALARCGADVLLAGHNVQEDTGRTARRFDTEGRSALVVPAGAATPARVQGEPHSFNLIRVQHPHIKVERFAWRAEDNAFKPASSETFRRTPDGWTRLSDEVAAGITFADDTTGLQPTIPQGE